MRLARRTPTGHARATRLSLQLTGLLLTMVMASLVCGFLALLPGRALAVKAAPGSIEVAQPDGTRITLYLKGDERLHWNEDQTGFPIVRSADGASWVYARLDATGFVPTSYLAGKVDPRSVGLSKPEPAKLRAAAQLSSMPAKDTGGPLLAPKTGTMRNLVVLVNFSDLSITRSVAAYDSLFNVVNYTFDGAAGSVKDFYNEASYGQLTVQSTVVGPVTLSSGYAYYGGNDVSGNDLRPRQMVQQALALVEASGFNFATMDADNDGWVDGLTIIHAGGGEEYSGNDPNYIWSHQWQLASYVTYDGKKLQVYHTEPARRGWDAYPNTQGITRIGVICHENGHFLGLPDLYDYTYTSEGAGDFCLMGGGSWNGSYGTKPAHPSAWCKSYLTWLTPTVITGTGSYSLNQVETNQQVYKLRGTWPSTQYMLVENRQGVGFDSGLPGTNRGILIWHVDETIANNNNKAHYKVDLEEASGTQHLELNTANGGDDLDYFRSGNATDFTSTTTPNNLSYTSAPLGLDIYAVSATGSTMSFLVNPLTIAITAPTPGASLNVGGTYPISWTQSGTPDSVSIFLSLDSGSTWPQTVAHGLTGVTSYLWTVPNYPVPTARIKVDAYSGGHLIGTDTMDGDFTINGGPRRYVSPAGGNVSPYTLPAWAAHTIGTAIAAANPGDSILVAAATYAEAVVIDKPVYLLGGWNAGFSARDPELNVTTIQSTGSAVVFNSGATGSPGIEGFTIAGGAGSELFLPDLGAYGGGILVDGSSPIIKDNVIAGCGYTSPTSFSAGGGIACTDGSVTITANTISGCVAQSGGGIYLYLATASITGNRISGASPNAEYTGAKKGGGVCAVHSTVTMSGNVVSGNTGYQEGGGVYAKLSPLSISGDSIRANAATVMGGGIRAEHSALTVDHASISGNLAAAMGGGIYFTAAQLDLRNSVVASNRSYSIAGGIYADSTWGAWTNNTIDRNYSGYTGGNVMLVAATAPLDVRNNIVSYGSPNGFQASAAGNVTFQYNDCFGNAPENVVTIVPDATNLSANPMYADTTAMDYHLALHSAAVDAGDPAAADPDGSVEDQGAFGGPSAMFAAPDWVQDAAATAVNDTTIQVSWTGVLSPGLDYYAVYSDTAAGFKPGAASFLASVGAGSSTFQHHPVAGCYYYRVCAVKTNGYAGGWSVQTGACAAGIDLIPPAVAITAPNGAETFAPGDTVAVRWIASDNVRVDSIGLYYSTNAGRDFVMMAHGEPNDSLYRWVVPEIASDSCLVRAVAYDPAMNTGSDASDGYFTVRAATPAGRMPLFALAQNYPNPFNPTTTIEYSVAKAGPVEISVFDASGRKIRTLVAEVKAPGAYKAVWDGRNDRGVSVASGLYLYRLRAASFLQQKKMILLR